MNRITSRPYFEGPEQYLEHALDCLAAGCEPLPPETHDELLAVLNERPEYARRWLPSAKWCRLLGIDPDIGKPVEPLGERERERLLVTIRDDDEFRVALRFLILGGAAA